MSRWTLRPVQPEDRLTIQRIAQVGLDTYAAFTPGWTRPRRFDETNERRLIELLPDPMFFGAIAESGGEPIGYVTLWQAHTQEDPPHPIPRLGHLAQIFVLPEWWGRGVATELLDAAVAEARRREYERIRLLTPKHHVRARRFYEREGWQPTGHEHVGEQLGLELVEYALDL